jgi:Na+/phosphate symporter
MKKQITRLSPHQNGKIAAVIMAIISVIFMLPFVGIMTLFSSMMPQDMGAQAPHFPMFSPILLFIIGPVFYLIIGYISAAVFCLLYNVLVPMLGGFEFELENQEEAF